MRESINNLNIVESLFHAIKFNGSMIKLLAALMCVVFVSTGFAGKKSWSGTTSSDWTMGSNWVGGKPPKEKDDANIMAGAIYYPIIVSTQSIKIDNLTIETSASLTMNGGSFSMRDLKTSAGSTCNQQGGLIEIRHTWKNKGTFNATGGSVQFAGKPGRGVDFSAGTNQFFNVIVDDGIDPKFDKKVNSSVLIAGNFTNNNPNLANSDNATFTFNGAGDQTITSATSAGNATFGNLEINKASGQVSLASNIEVSDALVLTSGNFATGSNTLTLGTSTSSVGSLSRNSGTIVGRLKRWFSASTATDVVFPVGTSSYYLPANINFTAAPTTGGTLTTFFESTDPGEAGLPLDDGGTNIVNCAQDGCWTITVGDGLMGGTYSLDLTADGFGGVSDYTTLRILKRADAASPWTLDGAHSTGTGSNETPVVHRTGMSGFSQFGVGGASDNPLPIQLAYFNAAVVSNSSDVLLTWGTITETNNYGFYIQQSIDNAASFADLPNSFVPGQGTTLIPHEYSWTHMGVAPGAYYYRIKQIDLDGTTHFTDAVQVIVDGVTGVENKTVPEVFSLAQNYPNPFNPTTTIQFAVAKSGFTTLTVFDAIGQEVASLFSGNAESGQLYTVQFDATNFADGMYFYKLAGSDQSSIRKMILLK